MTIRIHTSIAAAGLILAANVAQAAVSPLDPAYYQGQSARTATADIQAARYVDSTNPLTPTYYEGKGTVTFQATAAHVGRPYVDSSNPLDPSYRAK